MPPLPRHNYNYLNDKERGGPLSFVRFWRFPMPPPPPQTPQYLTILMTGKGGAIIILYDIGASQCPPPSPDATIPNYLDDRESGRQYPFYDTFFL